MGEQRRLNEGVWILKTKMKSRSAEKEENGYSERCDSDILLLLFFSNTQTNRDRGLNEVLGDNG